MEEGRIVKRALLALIMVALPGAAVAHHSVSMFDRDKVVTLAGTVQVFEWTNPHVWIEIVMEDGDMMVIWDIEGSSPRVLAREGWRPSLIKPGDRISITIYPRKDGETGGYYADIGPLYVNGELRIMGLEGVFSSYSSD